MKWWLNWLWLRFCLAVHQDGENQINWALPRIKAALRRDQVLEGRRASAARRARSSGEKS
jgi:hypothetical protein